ncbi:hypothetical protein SCG7086_DP_00030 [Chlamydiales bacterium SCGC AG-110-P3]|nr:hypothetical protein SCG7086_DP_00030 [Chlamydiales bacterium SCGC AG-110-P3]
MYAPSAFRSLTKHKKQPVVDKIIRLSKLMAQQGICSRREADRYIEDKQVLADGVIVGILGTKVPSSATVELLEKASATQDRKVTILLNKPIGYVSTQPEKGYTPAIELVTADRRWSGSRGPRFNRHHLRKLSVALHS